MKWSLFLKAFRDAGDFKGRASREEYRSFIFYNGLISAAVTLPYIILLLIVMDITISGKVPEYSMWTRLYLPGLILFIISVFYLSVSLLPTASVAVRRLHDTNRRGWWLLLHLILIVGSIWYFYLASREGDEGANRFGEPPVTEDQEEKTEQIPETAE